MRLSNNKSIYTYEMCYMRKGAIMAKPIPAGKKGKGMRALKKKAPQVAKAMGYKKGGKAKRRK